MPTAKRAKKSKKHRVKAAQKPPDSYSPLLSLPAELRNRIFEYALQYPGGVRLGWTRGKKKPNKKNSKKPTTFLDGQKGKGNQTNLLQYVYRQVRQEVAGLEVRYNAVLFNTTSGRPKGENITSFLHFYDFCAPSRRLWLTHVILDNPYKPRREGGMEEHFEWIIFYEERLSEYPQRHQS